MPYGLKITALGPNISPNPALQKSSSDDVDDAAVLYGDRLLLRVDPRDVRKSPDNPTGRKQIHYQAPARDALLFSGSGVSVGPVAGKYAGREVFVFTKTGTLAAGTHNDLRILPKTLNTITEFSVFGVGHFDATNNGSGSVKSIVGMIRGKTSIESLFCHQFSGGINYLSLFADQGDGGAGNHNLDTSTVVTAGIPFFYVFVVTASRIQLYINNLDTPVIDDVPTGAPETGQIELCIGNLYSIDDGHQLAGAHGRLYLVQGDALDTADNRNAAIDLMHQLKNHYGIA